MRKATMNKNAAVVNLILVTIVVATTIEANIMKSLLALMHKMWLDIAMKISVMPLKVIQTHTGILIRIHESTKLRTKSLLNRCTFALEKPNRVL